MKLPINPALACFAAAFLIGGCASTTTAPSTPPAATVRIQEWTAAYYGSGFGASHGEDRFWVAISYVGDGPQEPPAEWIISVNYGPGLNPIKRLLHKPDAAALAGLESVGISPGWGYSSR